jgi:hypothetical protein
MRRIPLLLAAAIALTLTAAPAAFAQDDQNCEDFASQADAQAHLRADPSDPDGLDALPGPADGNDDRTADGHGDGIACERRPAPYDREPVFAPAPTTTAPPAPRAPPSEVVEPTPTTVPGGELPFTGPRDTQLPLGVGLLLAGAAIVVLARYRPRHARR